MMKFELLFKLYFFLFYAYIYPSNVSLSPSPSCENILLFSCIDETIDSFLEKYPELKERNTTEQERLRNTANWMDLAFYTIQPRNNKTFILNLIPRIVEGKTARYITGSGQTKPTTDRVNLFRSEGNCEKIKRPPRRKKEEILMANAAKLRGDNRTMVRI